MNTIAGLPYVLARFDQNGKTNDLINLPADLTDLFVISHGWNNNETEAEDLYSGLFESFVSLGKPKGQPAILGVIWPSKRFDESVAVAGEEGGASGAASLSDANALASQKAVVDKLDRMKAFFTDPAQLQTIDKAKALLPNLENMGSARKEFVDVIRSLVDPAAANREDASDKFFTSEGNELMKDLKVADEDLDEELTVGGGASLPLGVGSASSTGGAASFSDFLHGFKAAAMNLLNFTTYYEMKRRAGAVGKNGVAKLIDQLAPQAQNIHLIGHSFGGRVVTAIAASSTTDKIKSMTLLQAAFSHFGLSKAKKGFFRSVVDQQRIHGPIVITHTRNDKAVGIAYPLASRINGDKAAALGDENDEFGGMGRNGAQKMEPGEVVKGLLLPATGSYAFSAGKCFNLESTAFIKGHSDITGREVANALRNASQ